jgi:hypothetical protein
MRRNALGGPRKYGDPDDDGDEVMSAHEHSDVAVEAMQVAGVVVMASLAIHGTHVHAQLLDSGCIASALDAMRVHTTAIGPTLELLKNLCETEDETEATLGAEVLAAWEVVAVGTGAPTGLEGIVATVIRGDLTDEVRPYLCYFCFTFLASADVPFYARLHCYIHRTRLCGRSSMASCRRRLCRCL